MKTKAKILFILLLTWHITFAQIGGFATYQFLEVTTSPLAGSLGGKNISNPSSVELIFFNPALLDTTQRFKLSLNYQNYLAGINMGDMIFAFPKTNYGNFAFSVHYINYGKFDSYDQLGYYYGTFTAADYAPYLTYSIQIDTHVVVGVNLKAIFSHLENYTSYGYAFDFGLYIKVNQYLYFGLAARNIGKQIKPYYSQYEPLPVNITAGMTGQLRYSPLRFNFTLDYLNYWNLRYQSPINNIYLPSFADTISTVSKAEVIIDEVLRHTHFGVEILIHPKFNLIVGYNYRRGKELSMPTFRSLNGFSFGFIMKTKKIDITYSFQKYLTSTVNSFGLTLNLGNFYWKKILPQHIFRRY